MVDKLSESSVDMFEINISCPNVKEGGIAFGQSPDLVKEITSTLKSRSKKPIIMKLSPNVTDITVMARAAQEAGADAISLINTITGMKIDIHKRKFVLANKTGASLEIVEGIEEYLQQNAISNIDEIRGIVK